MSEPLLLSRLASSLTVHRIPGDIPYYLTEREEADAIASKESSIRNHMKWIVIDKGGSELDVREIDHMDVSGQYDREEVLLGANRSKYWKIRDKQISEERKARLIEDRKNILDKWTAEKMYRHLSARSWDQGKELIVNDDTLHLIKVLCFRLSDDFRFVSELTMDPRKGIMLRGNTGVGKTFIAECLQENERHPIQIHTMLEISDAVQAEGHYKGIRWDDFSIVYLDDVGTEEPVVTHYGTRINWFKKFIEGYYMKSRGYYHRLIISTNDSFDVLETKYGRRVRSRLAEMFNIVDVTGQDLRKLPFTYDQTTALTNPQ